MARRRELQAELQALRDGFVARQTEALAELRHALGAARSSLAADSGGLLEAMRGAADEGTRATAAAAAEKVVAGKKMVAA